MEHRSVNINVEKCDNGYIVGVRDSIIPNNERYVYATTAEAKAAMLDVFDRLITVIPDEES